MDTGMDTIERESVMRRAGIITIVSSALIAVVGVALWFGARDTLEWVSQEDGIVEYATAILYLVCTVLFVQAGRQAGFNRLWNWGLAALVFFVAGEEVSWGQRIIGLQTPEGLHAVNVQGEFNLHNIDGIHQHIRMAAMLFVLVVCFAMPFGHRFLPQARALLERLRMPIFPFWAMPAAVLAVAFMVAPRLSGMIVFELDEFGELLLSVAMTGFAVASRAASRDTRQAAPVLRTSPAV